MYFFVGVVRGSSGDLAPNLVLLRIAAAKIGDIIDSHINSKLFTIKNSKDSSTNRFFEFSCESY